MKKWLRKKLNSILHDQDIYINETSTISSARVDDKPEIDGLRFSVMTASGGVIIQLRSYDKKTDRTNHSTYIIPDGEPVAERIGQIVSLELLKA